MTWSNVGLGNYSKTELGLCLARGGRGGVCGTVGWNVLIQDHAGCW